MNVRPPLPALALLLVGSSLAGCVANDASVQIAYVCAPAKDASSCAPTGGVCETFLTGQADYWVQYATTLGIVDNGLFFFMEVHNQRPNNASSDQGLNNTADARITEYDLSYGFPGNPYSLPDYTVTAITVTVPAAGSTTPFVTLIPAELSLQIQSMLPAGSTVLLDIYVRFKGTYVDGSSFETGKFKVATYVHNSVFPGYGCTNSTDIVTNVCPNPGQTSSWTCASPT